MIREGETIAGRFELLRLAGADGMARVFEARDRQDGRILAVKVGRAEDANEARRFLREAEVLSELSHPSIVRYVAHGRVGDDCFLAMEWLEGEDLYQRLRRGALTTAETVQLGRRALDALGAAHARGVVHRDIKPSNLFLPEGDIDRVKILDFGIAALDGSTRRLTKTGMSMGTPGYMAPEQARGERALDARADIFALGCVLFECLAGRPAFVAGHPMALLGMILFEESPRVSSVCPGLPIELDDIVARMLAKSPEDRYEGADAAARALARVPVAAGAPSEAPPARAPSLTHAEQRIVSVVVTSVGLGMTASAPTVQLTPGAPVVDPVAPLREAAERHGARLELLADGSIVAVLPSSHAPTEQASRAARCALAMRAALPGAPMVLATGRGTVQGRFPVGEVIDRAALALHGAPSDAVRIDDVTAGLIDAHFDVRTSGGASDLFGEHVAGIPTRMLLGKPTPCVGRDRELGLLASTFRECTEDGVASAVLLIGSAGAGKSRLAHEFLRTIKEAAGQLEPIILRGDPLSAGSAFGMLAPGVRRAARILEGEPVASAREKLRGLVGRLISSDQADRVTKFLGEMVGVPYHDASNAELRAARADALLMGDQVRAAWQAWLAAICAHSPLVIVLEDLHHGDLPTVQAVDDALRTLRDQPFMVLALARPEVHERFPRLWADRNVVEARLGGLGRRASEKLVRAALGDGPNADEIAAIVTRADGNPLYLEELSRAYVEGNRGTLPETVLGMLEARFDGLPLEARRTLRAASVFGNVFWTGALAALAATEHGTVGLDEWVDELERQELVERRDACAFPGENELAFRSAMVREAAYATLTPEDRALGHRLAGAWLEAKGEHNALVLAEHFERGQVPERALAFYRRAAEQALDGNDFDGAVVRAERAAELGAAGEELGLLRLLQAEALGWRGAFEKAAHHALLAAELLAPGTQAWHRALGEIVNACAPLGRHDEVMHAARELLRHRPTDASGEPTWVVSLCRAVNQLALAGKHALACELLVEIDARAAGLAPNQMVAARIFQSRAFVAFGSDRLGEALEGHRAAAACFEQAGARRHRLASLTHLSFFYLELGQFARAEHLMRETLAASERMGLTMSVATARINLGFALARQGRTSDPMATGGQPVSDLAAVEDRRIDGISRGYLAEILALGGDLAGAERQAARAVEMLASFPALRARALGILGQVYLAADRVDAALDATQEGMALLEEQGALLIGESLLRLMHARSLARAGATEEARAAIRTARACLERRASRLEDLEIRETFLRAVPENAETLALAAEWLGSEG